MPITAESAVYCWRQSGFFARALSLVLKMPRYDTNGVVGYEVTATAERHAQAERTKKQKREEKATSWGGFL